MTDIDEAWFRAHDPNHNALGYNTLVEKLMDPNITMKVSYGHIHIELGLEHVYQLTRLTIVIISDTGEINAKRIMKMDSTLHEIAVIIHGFAPFIDLPYKPTLESVLATLHHFIQEEK